MARNRNQRIDTNVPSDSGFTAFAGLDSKALGDLPDGPKNVAPAEADSKIGAAGRKPRVILRKETAHRGGKAVIVIDDFPPQTSDDKIAELATGLRRACGSGGTVRDRLIEIQGDQAARIRKFLEQQGYRVDGVK